MGLQLLPARFSLTELQEVYEAILDKKLDKRNFRRKLSRLKILRPTGEFRRSGRRPARWVECVAGNFEKLKDKRNSVSFLGSFRLRFLRGLGQQII